MHAPRKRLDGRLQVLTGLCALFTLRTEPSWISYCVFTTVECGLVAATWHPLPRGP